MAGVVATTAILGCSALLCIIGFLHRRISAVLLAAFALRLAAALFHYYVTPLPGGMADALTFENAAWEMSQDWWGHFADFGFSASYFYSFLMAIPYALTDRSPLMLQAFSVLVGTLNVYLVWKLAAELWGRQYALRSAWIVAVLPVPLMYAALTMREAYFVFFLLLALLFVARCINTGRRRHMAAAALAIGVGSAFHAGMVVAFLALVAWLVLAELTRFAKGLAVGTLSLRSLAIISAACFGLLLLFVLDPSIPKLGRPTELLGPERYLDVLGVRARGDASYPDWMVPKNGVELLYVAPLRVGYFLFSPFLWDVRAPAHIIGVVDAVLYALLVAGISANFDIIRKNKAALVVLFVTVSLIVAFSMGTSNFGSALRHRSKFIAVLVVLAVPAYTQFRRKIPK